MTLNQVFVRFIGCLSLIWACFYSADSFSKNERRYAHPDKTITPSDYPWLVYIHGTDRGSPQCTGSLIADNLVLTAAHCVLSCPAISEVLVSFSNFQSEPELTDIPVSRILASKSSAYTLGFDHLMKTFGLTCVTAASDATCVRPLSGDSLHFLMNSILHDIVVLVLEKPVDVDKYGIRLPVVDQAIYTCNLLKDKEFMVAGHAGNLTLKMDKTRLENMSLNCGFKKCYESDNNNSPLTVYMTDVAVYAQGGDSGGPIFYMEEDQAKIIGVLSYGIAYNTHLWPIFAEVVPPVSEIEHDTPNRTDHLSVALYVPTYHDRKLFEKFESEKGFATKSSFGGEIFYFDIPGKAKHGSIPDGKNTTDSTPLTTHGRSWQEVTDLYDATCKNKPDSNFILLNIWLLMFNEYHYPNSDPAQQPPEVCLDDTKQGHWMTAIWVVISGVVVASVAMTVYYRIDSFCLP